MEQQPKSAEEDDRRRTRKQGTLYMYQSRPNLASAAGERDHHHYLLPSSSGSSSSRELKKAVNMGPADHGDDGTERRKKERVVALRRVVTTGPSAEVKLAGVAVSLNVRLRSADMPPIMQERAFHFTRSLLLVDHEITTTTTTTNTNANPNPNPTDIARTLKKQFDAWYGPAWHCIVGKSFGSFVTHSGGGFLYFSIDKLSVLLFKTAVRPVIFDMGMHTPSSRT